MPNVRCRSYRDDGQPVGNGCRNGSECNFVHPDSPQWERARKGNSFNAGPRSSGSFGGNGPARRTSDSWGVSNNASASSNTTQLPETGSRWGTNNAQAGSSSGIEPTATVDYPGKVVQPTSWNVEPSTWESSGGWGTSGDGGWGSSGDGGWGAAAGSGWGATGSTDTTGGGWTTSDSAPSGGMVGDNNSNNKDTEDKGKRNAGAAAGSGWGATNSSDTTGGGWTTSDSAPSGWKAGDNNSNNKDTEDKGKRNADITMRDPSPAPRMPIPLPPPRNVRRESQASEPDLPPLRIDAKTSPQSPSQSPIATSSPSTARPTIPLPRTKPKANPLPVPNLKKMALEHSASKTAQETGNVYIQENSDTQSPAPPDPKKYIGPKGRVALFADNLTHLRDLVVSHVILDRAQQDDDRWKRTQNSEIYAHATPLTRDLLDAHRGGYNKKVVDAKKKHARTLKALVSLPEFPPKSKTINPKIAKEVVAKYTEELRDWLKDLQVHKRLLVERDAREDIASEPLLISGSTAMETQPPQPTGRELLERGNWTWTELKDATDMLENCISSTTEQVYSERFTRYSDLDDQLQKFPVPMEVEDAVEDGTRESVDNLVRGINRVGDDLGAQAVRAADLFKKIDELQVELDVVVAEKEKMNVVWTQAEKQFQEFELSKQAQITEIRELAEKLQKLHLHKRLRPPSSSPPPVKIDDIYEYIRPLILKRMTTEMSPVLEALRQRCLENQEDIAKEIDELVKPAVDMTDAICQRVMSMTLAQASAQASV